MVSRAYWQGQIRLALVSIPVEIYPALRSGASISFRQIHEPSGKPISYEKVVQGIGPVDRDDIVKGYEIAKGNYVLLEDDEIEAVKIESRKTFELVQFVDQHEIDVFYFEKPYYVIPADDLANEAFIVLREALRKAGKVGLGQLSVRGREMLASLKPCGKGLVLETLRYADEVRQAQSYFKEIPDQKPDAELLELATTLIERKTAPFDADAFEDRYVEALRRLVEKKAKAKAKAKGKKVLEDVEAPGAKAGNVIDLMAALKNSVGSGKAPTKEPSPQPTKRVKTKTRSRAPSSSRPRKTA